MDGFKRPIKPQQAQDDAPRSQPRPQPVVLSDEPPLEELPVIESPLETRVPGRSRRKWFGIGLTVVAILAVIGAWVAYNFLLSPRDSSAIDTTIPVEIVSGMAPSQIADKLEEAGAIRSSFAFTIYTRLHCVQNELQAGNYEFSSASSTPDIVLELQGGPGADEIEVMFKPGATLTDNKDVLLGLGYSGGEIDAAFTASYDHPLLASRPEGSDLEGYIFGETHRFVKGATIKEILERYFDDYYAVIEENDLVNRYKQQGLSLFEGITLASIVQRESGGDDKAQIAQVFLLRLSEDMPLGSDVTYQYIADKEGNPRDVNYDSPYNTRVHAGLPPGPIASPGAAALRAVGIPAEGDYLYFLSGDDDVTYFGRTLEEHEANIRDRCQQKCTIL